jgi:hypothetical protein
MFYRSGYSNPSVKQTPGHEAAFAYLQCKERGIATNG